MCSLNTTHNKNVYVRGIILVLDMYMYLGWTQVSECESGIHVKRVLLPNTGSESLECRQSYHLWELFAIITLNSKHFSKSISCTWFCADMCNEADQVHALISWSEVFRLFMHAEQLLWVIPDIQLTASTSAKVGKWCIALIHGFKLTLTGSNEWTSQNIHLLNKCRAILYMWLNQYI